MPRRIGPVIVSTSIFLALCALLTHWWWPWVDYTAFRFGGSPIKVAGVRIEIAEPWYLVKLYSGGVKSDSSRPTIILAKPHSLPFHKTLTIAISKLSVEESEKLGREGPHQAAAKSYPWGTVAILRGGRAALVKEYGIVITDDDDAVSYLSSALNDIRAISVEPQANSDGRAN